MWLRQEVQEVSRRLVVRLLVVAAVGTVIFYSVRPPSRGPTFAADSAVYVEKLARYTRDSMVIDSIARTIDVSELYRLTSEMLRAQSPMPWRRMQGCELWRLKWDHGIAPTEVAGVWVEDRLTKLLGPKVFEDMLRRMPQTGVISEGDDYIKCRGNRPERLKALGTTSLDVQPWAPIPPRGWP